MGIRRKRVTRGDEQGGCTSVGAGVKHNRERKLGMPVICGGGWSGASQRGNSQVKVHVGGAGRNGAPCQVDQRELQLIGDASGTARAARVVLRLPGGRTGAWQRASWNWMPDAGA